MGFFSILIGFIVGGLVSEGAMIGLAFAGKLVTWWLALILGAVGCLFGGFVAGMIARGPGSGALAGFLTGLIVFLATFLIIWLVLKAQFLQWWNDLADINLVIDELLAYMGIPEGSDIADSIRTTITDYYNQYSGDIEQVINKYFPIFGLIVGAIFGGICSVVNIFSGLIGGLITRKKETYESYY